MSCIVTKNWRTGVPPAIHNLVVVHKDIEIVAAIPIVPVNALRDVACRESRVPPGDPIAALSLV